MRDDLLNIKLIERVKEKEALYSKTCHGHSDPVYSKNAWVSIATDCGISVDDAKKRWSSLKLKFIRLRKKLKTSGKREGETANFNQIWPLYYHMEFISPHVAIRKRRMGSKSTIASLEGHTRSLSMENRHEMVEKPRLTQSIHPEFMTVSVTPSDLAANSCPDDLSFDFTEGHTSASTSRATTPATGPKYKLKSSPVPSSSPSHGYHCSTPKSAKREGGATDSLETILKQHMEQSSKQFSTLGFHLTDHRQDQVDLFCRGFAAGIKALPGNKQHKVLVDIMQLIYEAANNE